MASSASIFAKLILDSSEYTKGLNKSKTDTNTFTKQGKSALGGLGTAFQTVTGFSLGTAGAIGLLTVALTKAVAYTKQAIEANDIYVSSIVDMARFTGDNTDELSRMVQVADDAFLSQTDLNTAIGIGAKKGLDMSIQGIKDLADQYNALETQEEKNKLLNDNFGRSGLEMGKLLELGSAGITAQMEAIADNLVVTEKSKEITYEYKRSVDALNDALDGIKYTVAQNTIPALTDINVILADIIEKTNDSEKEMGDFGKYSTATFTTAIGVGNGLALVIKAWADKIRETHPALEEQAGDLQITADQAQAAADAINVLGKAQLSIVESVMSAETSFNEKYTSLMEERTQLQADATTATGEDLDQINADLAENSLAIQKNADDYELAKNKILLGYTEQLLAADGLTQEEVNFLLEKGQEWGIYSDTAVAEMQAVMAEASLLTSSLTSVPEEVSTTFTTNHVDNYSVHYGSAGINSSGHALGGTTIAGSTSLVNERGIPEVVSVGNKDYLTMGSQNGTVTPLSNASDSSTDTMMVNALMSVIASNQALPKKIAHEIRQLEKYG